MKVKDLLDFFKKYQEREPDSDFLEWEIFTEQCTEEDKKHKRAHGWGTILDSEDWEYFRVIGFNTYFPSKNIVTINVNF